MKITGVICEYNPFHTGHKKQLDRIRSIQGMDSGIVCLMSGNFVQRGAPACIDKSLRAQAAVACGADLVLELPITAALSSAEGFASQGVSILSPFCHNLCFGAESGDKDTLLFTAQTLLSPAFPPALRNALDKGLSFPAARQEALEAMGVSGTLLKRPNDILAVEYCKAILSQNSKLIPMPILREGDYHETKTDSENPSATSLRQLMEKQRDYLTYVPEAARSILDGATYHALHYGENAILGRLRSMSEEEFSALPYGSEGLWRKLMRSVREQASLEEILTATKSKRYTRTRLDRMVLCAFLGITQGQLNTPTPYVRVLAFNNRGREILKTARYSAAFPNAGESTDNPYQALENRCGDLYGLFAETPEPPGLEQQRRVCYLDM